MIQRNIHSLAVYFRLSLKAFSIINFVWDRNALGQVFYVVCIKSRRTYILKTFKQPKYGLYVSNNYPYKLKKLTRTMII